VPLGIREFPERHPGEGAREKGREVPAFS